MFWILFGHVLIAALAGLIFRQGRPSVYDLLYWAAVAALIGARYIDITRYHGETAEGERATLDHFRRFAIYVLASTSTLWLAIYGLQLMQKD